MQRIMNIVIDIQGLKDRSNEFIPKEIAIISVNADYNAHWIVSAPHAYKSLPPSVKRQNTWLTDNHHGIEWSAGETSLRAVENILKKIAVQSDRIFTRGSDKANYLSQLTGCFIINLEEDETDPSFRNLPPCNTLCIYHSVLCKNSSFRCALNSAAKIKKWLCHSDRINSLWEYRTTTTWYIGLGSHKELATSHEQPADTPGSPEYKESYYRCISCRSHSPGVDETDCNCSQH